MGPIYFVLLLYSSERYEADGSSRISLCGNTKDGLSSRHLNLALSFVIFKLKLVTGEITSFERDS